MNKEQLPIVIHPAQPCSKQEFFNLLSSHQETLREKLIKYGGVLFRGFPLKNPEDFSEAIKALNLGDFVDYIGGDSPRSKVTEGVYTSTEAPSYVKIPLHNELSFIKKFPKNIYFFCEVPPKDKGETILADARKVYSSIDPSVRERWMSKNLRYVSCYYFKSKFMKFVNKLVPSHKSWIQVFETDCKHDVERKCGEHEFGFSWAKNDWLQISQIRPAAINHPETGEMVWFNQAHLFDFNRKLLGTWRHIAAKLFYFRKHTKLHQVFYEDGSSIARADLYHALKVLDSHKISFPWQKGDFLILDNVLTMHGRSTFKGKRRVLTAMTSPSVSPTNV